MSKCDKKFVAWLSVIAVGILLFVGVVGGLVGHYAFPRRIYVDTERAQVKFEPRLGQAYPLRGLNQIMATEAFWPEPDLQTALEFILREPDKMHEGWSETRIVTIPLSDTKRIEGIDPGLIVFTILHGRRVALYNLPAADDTTAAQDRVWTAFNVSPRPDSRPLAQAQ